MFIWRRASPSKRAGFNPAFTWLVRLAESPGLTTFIFPRNPKSDICIQVFILHPTHKQTELVKGKVILKNAGQDKLARLTCRVYGALTC